jgi:hypothetical protein
MPTVPPTTTYGKPRYTTHRNPYATRHYHFKGTRASQPYYLHKYDDINKQLKFEKKAMKAMKKGGTRRRGKKARYTRRR